MARSKNPKPVLPFTVQDTNQLASPEKTNYLGWFLTLIFLGVVIVLAVFYSEIIAFFKGLLFVAGPGLILPTYKIVPNDEKTDMFGNPVTDKPDHDPVDWTRHTTKTLIIPGVYNHNFNRSKKRLPVGQVMPSSDFLSRAGFVYEWFVEPYAYENAEEICKRRNGRLIYFDSKEEFIAIKSWTKRNVTDRHPLEHYPYYYTAGIRPFVDEKETPYPDDESFIPVISNLKWRNSDGKQEDFTGNLGDFSPWCEDRNKALGSKKFEEGVIGIGWGSILKAIAEEDAEKLKSPMRWNAEKSIKYMLNLTVVMDFSMSNVEDERMGCWLFEYGQSNANKKADKQLNESNRPSGLPFICKIGNS